MEKKTSSYKSGGVGFCSLLALLFIYFKLTGNTVIATWSWWWVLSPLWVPIIAFIVILALVLLIMKLFGKL
jgi:hypothetical protein